MLIDTSREYIICAAIWYPEKLDVESPRGFIAQNISYGMVIGQWRHCNCIHVRKQCGLPRKYANPEDRSVQGFLTSKGNFVDRWQASEIAYHAGQISKETAIRKTWNGKYISALGDEPKERWGECDDYQFSPIYSEDIY